MQVFIHPDKKDWKEILRRPAIDQQQLMSAVNDIIEQVKNRGDDAIIELTKRFDGAELNSIEINPHDLTQAAALIPDALRLAIIQAAANIEKFHLAQVQLPVKIETMPGINCWRKSVAIEKVGLYIPGGTAPLFSTILMLGIPARIAGCREVILCSPPNKDGSLNPAILFTAALVGITKIYRIGGVQAIAAMAYGTATVPAVNKIFGPGNQFVTAAKQQVQQQGMAIDMPAGPSEVAVFADASANAAFVAADLLSQAEHGADSQVLLVTTAADLIPLIEQELQQQLQQLDRKDLAIGALKNSKAVVVRDNLTAIEMLNQYAPEHLILATDNAALLAEQVVNAGSVFLGHFSPESVGDYASGTNHTLPTNGYASVHSGVSLDSFIKKISFQQMDKKALQTIAPTVIAMAEAEGLDAHARAVTIRTNS
jgi:histidinol dehydrogenase